MMKKEKWYQTRLAKYFEDNYGEYSDDAAFYVNPAINQWFFDIPELKISVMLTCEDNGVVLEDVTPL